jgi:hypothetical protein
MKITTETWMNKTAFIPFRRKVRAMCDEFRSVLDEYLSTLEQSKSVVQLMKTKVEERTDDRISFINTLLSDLLRHKNIPNTDHQITLTREIQQLIDRLEKTAVWRKLAQLQPVMDWLHLAPDINPSTPRHSFRLLTLEMWCNTLYKEDSGVVTKGRTSGDNSMKTPHQPHPCSLSKTDRTAFSEWD